MADVTSAPSSAPSTGGASATPSAPSTPASGSTGSTPTPVNGATSSTQTPAPETKAEQRRLLQLKVDGRDEEYDIDKDLDSIRRFAQIGRAKELRFEDISKRDKELQELERLYKEDPYEALKRAGHDPDAIAQRRLEERIKNEQLTPEQREIAQLKQQLEQHKTEAQKFQQEREQEEQQRMQDYQAQRFDQMMTKTLQESGLPKTPETIKRLAGTFLQHFKHGIELDPADAVAMVRESYQEEARALYAALDGEALYGIFGEDMATKLQQAHLARLTKAQLKPPEKQPEPSEGEKPARRRLTREELMAKYG